ncbi:ribosome recycling factor family protein [Vibrio furnissii]|uniref:ribosome recycling factor family protein n=1 Tax=Vibrio furnissii TaxID=29494 RepID=UPI001E3D8F30|nr:ribosome recycling factor family protein [Vibrio furnissii]
MNKKRGHHARMQHCHRSIHQTAKGRFRAETICFKIQIVHAHHASVTHQPQPHRHEESSRLVTKVSDSMLTIALPSLIHRIGREHATALQAFATEHRCTLKRVRRSRNWQCQGEPEDMLLLLRTIQASEMALSVSFVVTKLESGIQPYRQDTLSERLAHFVRENPAMTLAELMEKTDCTVAQARAAREAQETW